MRRRSDSRFAVLVVLAVLLSSLCVSCGLPARSRSDESSARIVQTIAAFDRPESVAFDLAGEHLFVGNCASGLFGTNGDLVGFVRGQGAISKLSVDGAGRAEMLAPRLVEGLDGPLGLAVLPFATELYPRGTLLVNVGLALLVDENGAPISDASELGTGILLLDPDTGERLGKIELGVGSAIAAEIGHEVLLPNSLAFDGGGNLFVTDTARGGDRLRPERPGRPGLLRIPRDAIDNPSRGGTTFTGIPGIPNGVGYWPAEDAICVVTMGGQSPEGEAIHVVPARSFPRESMPEPLRVGVGTADGIAFTPAGTIITSRFAGDLLAVPRGGAPTPIRLDPDVALVAPADHRLIECPDGSCLLAVPEQARTEPTRGTQRVRLIRLPPGF